MDVRIEAAPMAAEAEIPSVVVTAEVVGLPDKVILVVSQVASFSCPSIAGHSLSAVAPDHNFLGGTALAAA